MGIFKKMFKKILRKEFLKIFNNVAKWLSIVVSFSENIPKIITYLKKSLVILKNFTSFLRKFYAVLK